MNFSNLTARHILTCNIFKSRVKLYTFMFIVFEIVILHALQLCVFDLNEGNQFLHQ